MTSLKPLALTVGLLAVVAAAPAFAQDEKALVARGEYLARAGDCVACHTAPGGKPFAGGLAIESDLGKIFSTNITSDKQHGIGAYSEAQFAAAVRDGIRADGTHLYPAMPYVSYSKLSNDDMHALYTYFTKAVAPDANQPPQTALGFPFSQRWGMALWNRAFGSTGEFKANPAASAEVNRGAYLVEGLGHCGSCHTPRGVGMQETAYTGDSAKYLSGSELNGWTVPSLRAGGEAQRGIMSWSVADIVDYLGKGRNRVAAVNGEMKPVVEHSLGYLNDSDLKAIAVYLKTLPGTAPAVGPATAAAATTDKLTHALNLTPGERLYIDNCNACHFVTGQGGPGVFPHLDGASIVNGENPTGLIHTILAGAQTPSTDRAPSVLPMPGFAYRLSDADVAALATFLRQAWTNKAPAVTTEQVAKVRAGLKNSGERVDAQAH